MGRNRASGAGRILLMVSKIGKHPRDAGLADFRRRDAFFPQRIRRAELHTLPQDNWYWTGWSNIIND